MSLGVQPRLQDPKTFSQVVVTRAAKVENHLPRGTSIWKCRPGSLQGGGAAEMSPHGGMRFLKPGQREEERSGKQMLRKCPPLRDRRAKGEAK